MSTYHQSYTFHHKSRLNTQPPAAKVIKGSRTITVGLWSGGETSPTEDMYDYFCNVNNLDPDLTKQLPGAPSLIAMNEHFHNRIIEGFDEVLRSHKYSSNLASGNFRECHCVHPLIKLINVKVCQNISFALGAVNTPDATDVVFPMPCTWHDSQKHSYHDKVLNSGLVSDKEVFFTPETIKSNFTTGQCNQLTSADRSAFFESLPKNKVGVALGVDTAGATVDYILPLTQPSKLYLVDPWSKLKYVSPPPPMNNCWISLMMFSHAGKHNEAFDYGCVDAQIVRDRLPEEHKDRVVLVEEFSSDASKDFGDESLDWIHSDWSGEYTQKMSELFQWLPKVKEGGYLTGEIFCLEGLHNPPVFSAVLEFMVACVANRPDLLEKHYEEKLDFIESCSDFYKNRNADERLAVHSPQYAFGDVVVAYSFTGSDGERYDNLHCYQLKPSEEILKCLGETGFIEYYPNCRSYGGSYKIKVGDWVSKNGDSIRLLSNRVQNDENLNNYFEWRVP